MVKNDYELPERTAIARYLRRDLPVVELGGSIGVVACVTNRLLKDRTADLVVGKSPGHSASGTQSATESMRI